MLTSGIRLHLIKMPFYNLNLIGFFSFLVTYNDMFINIVCFIIDGIVDSMK